MDCPDKIPLSGTPACHRSNTLIGMMGPPLGIIATPDVLTMITKIGRGLVVPSPTHITMDIGVAAS